MVQHILPRYGVVCGGVDVTNMCESGMWEETTHELSTRISVTLDLDPKDGPALAQQLAIGQPLQVFADGNEVARGRVEVWEFDDEVEMKLTLTAYTAAYNLMKSQDDFLFIKSTGAHTALGMIGVIAARYGITIDAQIPDAEIGPRTFQQQSPAQAIVKILMDLRMHQKGGALDFIIRSTADGSGLEILPPGTNGQTLAFTPTNVTRVNDRWSAEDLITEVVLVGQQTEELVNNNDPAMLPLRIVNQRLTAWKDKFGLRRALIYEQQLRGAIDYGPDALEQLVAERGEPARVQRITAPDVPTVRKGDAHYFRVGTLSGVVPVTGVTHDMQTATMLCEIDTSGVLGRYVKLNPPAGPLSGPGTLDLSNIPSP